MSPDQPNQTPNDTDARDAPPEPAVRKSGAKRTRKGQADPSGQPGRPAEIVATASVSGRSRRPPLERVKAVAPAPVEASPVGMTPVGAVPGEVRPAVADQPAIRRRRIAEAAYLKAERRGFQGNHQESDWLEAEREIDAAESF